MRTSEGNAKKKMNARKRKLKEQQVIITSKKASDAKE
jgi:hypothetical protein